MNIKKENYFILAAVIMILIAFIWAVPAVIAQVAGERPSADLPPFKAHVPSQDQNADLWKAGETPIQVQAASAKPDLSDLNDHRALLFDFKGNVRILKHDTDKWTPVMKNMKIEIGDQLLTEKDSHVDLAYDSRFLNVARIGANTKAEFRNIEPTDIHMEDGSIFSALDGLKGGESYQISTRTAVAGVRGTAFGVMVVGVQEKFFVLDEMDADIHKVEVTLLQDETPFDVTEGKELVLKDNEGTFSEISNEANELAGAMLEKVDELRNEDSDKAAGSVDTAADAYVDRTMAANLFGDDLSLNPNLNEPAVEGEESESSTEETVEETTEESSEETLGEDQPEPQSKSDGLTFDELGEESLMAEGEGESSGEGLSADSSTEFSGGEVDRVIGEQSAESAGLAVDFAEDAAAGDVVDTGAGSQRPTNPNLGNPGLQ